MGNRMSKVSDWKQFLLHRRKILSYLRHKHDKLWFLRNNLKCYQFNFNNCILAIMRLPAVSFYIGVHAGNVRFTFTSEICLWYLGSWFSWSFIRLLLLLLRSVRSRTFLLIISVCVLPKWPRYLRLTSFYIICLK